MAFGRCCSVSFVLFRPIDSRLKIPEGLIDEGNCFCLATTPIITGFCEGGLGGLQTSYTTVYHTRLIDIAGFHFVRRRLGTYAERLQSLVNRRDALYAIPAPLVSRLVQITLRDS